MRAGVPELDDLIRLAEEATGVAVAKVLWSVASVAAVAGARMADGREVVVRGFRAGVEPGFVEGVVRVQRHPAAGGFPCPTPLSGAVLAGGVLGRVESWWPDPGARRFAPEDMATSAAGLSEVVARAAGVDATGLDRHPMALPRDGLYPAPHSQVFDFSATAVGAEWIDDIARRARARMADSGLVVAHGDWSARNVRIAGGRLIAAYDWESVQAVPETTAVGIAAATWNALGETGEPLAPTAAEIERYVDEYALARNVPFTRAMRASACAAAVYALAYTARCEHAITPGTRTARASGRLIDAHVQALLSL